MRSDFSLSYCTEVGHTRSTRAFFATHKLLKRFMKAQLLEQSGTSRVVWGHREYIKIGILVGLATAVVQKESALTARSMKTTRLVYTVSNTSQFGSFFLIGTISCSVSSIFIVKSFRRTERNKLLPDSNKCQNHAMKRFPICSL